MLTAESVDPAGGIGFAFEFGGKDATYKRAANTKNDVLVLTSARVLNRAIGGE